MRIFLNIFLAVLLFGPVLTAQTNVYYSVRVGTFVDAQRSDFQSLRPFGFVYAKEVDENVQQVFVGGTSDRSAAEQTLYAARNAGFPSAFLQEKLEAEGNEVAVIQLATLDTRKEINWTRYAEIPNLYGILRGDQLKVVQGVFASIAETRSSLQALRDQGFRDAFPKMINSVYLFKLDAFETGIEPAKKPLFDLNLDESAPDAAAANTGRPDEPTSYGSIPAQRNTTTMTARSGAANTRATPLPPAETAPPAALPNIRPDVKRRSALELQKVLKQNGAYTGSLDGYYGPGTQAGYQRFAEQSRDMEKYRILGESLSLDGSGRNDAIQQSIDALPEDMEALRTLESSDRPIAKAYVAYTRFVNGGPSAQVDALMNSALSETFRGSNMAGMPRFDPQATYTYTDLEQVIQHLYYMHAAPTMDYAAPCWIIARHPSEIRNVQQRFLEAGGIAAPRAQACGQLTEWPAIRDLVAIARDLNPAQTLDDKTLAQAANLRTQYYYADAPLSEDMDKVLDSWEKRLWTRMEQWAAEDPLHQRLMVTFKVSYYQALVLMEDYFMNQGFSAKEAKTLALATQRTLVGYHLNRFTSY